MKDKIVLNNTGLIIKAMKDLNCQVKDDEDFDMYFIAGVIGLLKASKRYDETISKSSYLYKIVRREIVRQFITNTRYKRYTGQQPISLSTKVNDYIVDNELVDYIPDTYDMENEFIAKDYVKYLLSKLKDRKYKKYLIEYYGIGVPQLNIYELSRKYGISYQSVSNHIKVGLEKLRRIIESEEINIKNKNKMGSKPNKKEHAIKTRA